MTQLPTHSFWSQLAGRFGQYNDLQFSVLRSSGYTGSNASMLAAWLRAGAPTLGGSSGIDLFDADEVGGWYDPSDLTTLWKDTAGSDPVTADGDLVARIDDKSGNENHLLQATEASRPTYKTAGGLHWIEGDGAADWLRAAFTITQPWERVSAIQQVSWTTNDRIFGGAGGSSRGELQQGGGSPNLYPYSGTYGPVLGSVPVGTDAVVTEKHNGANSRIASNNNAYITGNMGTNAAGGITVFSQEAGINPANARCYGVIIRQGEMTDEQITQARDYLATKSGVTL